MPSKRVPGYCCLLILNMIAAPAEMRTNGKMIFANETWIPVRSRMTRQRPAASMIHPTIQRRMVSLDEIQHHLGLDHRQAAFPASDDNFILHTFFPTLLYILQKFPDRPYP